MIVHVTHSDGSQEDVEVDVDGVLRVIVDADKRGDQMWFSKLVKLFEGEIPRVGVSAAEDRLMDLCLIEGAYEKVGRVWTYCYHSTRVGRELVEDCERCKI